VSRREHPCKGLGPPQACERDPASLYDEQRRISVYSASSRLRRGLFDALHYAGIDHVFSALIAIFLKPDLDGIEEGRAFYTLVKPVADLKLDLDRLAALELDFAANRQRRSFKLEKTTPFEGRDFWRRPLLVDFGVRWVSFCPKNPIRFDREQIYGSLRRHELGVERVLKESKGTRFFIGFVANFESHLDAGPISRREHQLALKGTANLSHSVLAGSQKPGESTLQHVLLGYPYATTSFPGVQYTGLEIAIWRFLSCSDSIGDSY
jgi:hypothetical protein